MLNTKQTLKNLHKKFPMMGLDELFEVLDCYVEQSYFDSYKFGNLSTSEPNKVWCSTTSNGIESAEAKISPAIYKVECSNGKANTITNIDSLQLTTSH